MRVFFLVIAFIWNVPDCSGNSQSANYVRNLSSERLSKLYNDMEQFYQVSTNDRHRKYTTETAPKEFSDLEVVSIRPGNAQIMVIGCFDNYMYLDFYGIKDTDEKSIILRYGEFEITEEKIWQK